MRADTSLAIYRPTCRCFRAGTSPGEESRDRVRRNPGSKRVRQLGCLAAGLRVPGEESEEAGSPAMSDRLQEPSPAAVVAAIEVDYVIVGAGSAGAALAVRLREDPAIRVILPIRVILLEIPRAGPSVARSPSPRPPSGAGAPSARPVVPAPPGPGATPPPRWRTAALAPRTGRARCPRPTTARGG